MIRAKFVCTSIDTAGNQAEQVRLEAVTHDSDENRTWSEATPFGMLDMAISNPGAMGKFHTGEEYYLDFTPVK